MNAAPTTTVLVNKSIRTLSLEEIETGEHAKAAPLRNGFDGTTWMGGCPKEGLKKACLMLFWRKTDGTFIPVL